jgi:hypothetical protein
MRDVTQTRSFVNTTAAFYVPSLKRKRFIEFLNGMGTATHHASASFLVCMMTAGVVGPSRQTIAVALGEWCGKHLLVAAKGLCCRL